MVGMTPGHAAFAVTGRFKPTDTRQKWGHHIGRVQTASCPLCLSKDAYYMLQGI